MTLKKTTLALAVSLALLPASVFSAGWVDDWFDNANIGNSSSYGSQKRGYYSAGSFSGRINMGNDSLVTIAKPRISAGCGGIDAFMGGISFLDADYLVEKMENMLQAAPAIAFDMALKTMCKECSETLTKMEAAADWLNGLQLNECNATKRLVTIADPDDPATLSDLWSEINGGVSLSEAVERSWQEAQEKVRANNNEATTDLKTHAKGCPKEFKEIFKTGSIINHTTDKVGLGNYADLMRGFIGDVVIKADDTENVPLADKVLSCKENRQISIDDILTGKVHKKTLAGVCEKDQTKPLVDIIEENLKNIADKIQNRAVLTNDEVKFIKATTVIPVFTSLQDGIAKGNVNIKIEMMRDVVAVAYAHAMISDLYAHIERSFQYIDKVSRNPGIDNAAAPDEICNVNVFKQPIGQFKNLYQQLNVYRDLSMKSYNNKIIDLNNSLNLARSLKTEGDEIRRRNAQDYKE